MRFGVKIIPRESTEEFEEFLVSLIKGISEEVEKRLSEKGKALSKEWFGIETSGTPYELLLTRDDEGYIFYIDLKKVPELPWVLKRAIFGKAVKELKRNFEEMFKQEGIEVKVKAKWT